MPKLRIRKGILSGFQEELTLFVCVVVPGVITDEHIHVFLLQSMQGVTITLPAALIIKLTLGKGICAGTAKHTHTIGLAIILGIKEEGNRTLGMTRSLHKGNFRIAQL